MTRASAGCSFAPYTAKGGSLIITGEAVPSDKRDLERIVRQSKPPVKVVYQIWEPGGNLRPL
jgi:hypothetical protein